MGCVFLSFRLGVVVLFFLVFGDLFVLFFHVLGGMFCSFLSGCVGFACSLSGFCCMCCSLSSLGCFCRSGFGGSAVLFQVLGVLFRLLLIFFVACFPQLGFLLFLVVCHSWVSFCCLRWVVGFRSVFDLFVCGCVFLPLLVSFPPILVMASPSCVFVVCIYFAVCFFCSRLSCVAFPYCDVLFYVICSIYV